MRNYKEIGLENVEGGVLIYGPPGSGKTLLEKKILLQNELDELLR